MDRSSKVGEVIRHLLAPIFVALLPVWLLASLTACTSPQITHSQINITVATADETFSVQVPAGSTAQDAINAAGITLGELDRSEPPFYTILEDGEWVQVIRVREEFEIVEEAIPFERQVVRNLNLSEGEMRLVQAGKNGTREVTYRRLYEDGVETSRGAVKSVVVAEAVPEILMIGSRAPFATFDIPGILAYLSGGNAWVMDGSTGKRRAVVTSGKLDGRIFSLSPDGEWLLYTEKTPQAINTLWAAKTRSDNPTTVYLGVENVVHFADWVPNATLRVAYSTVEPRNAAPGWQANNDLMVINFSASGWLSKVDQLLEANSGGIYGWWGTTFAWSPRGSTGTGAALAYARPDSVGLVNLTEGTLESKMEITPYQTFGDWAWVPGLAWSPDGQLLYTVNHAAQAEGSAETSPLFDVTALPLYGSPITLITQSGMFAYPTPSPLQALAGGANDFRLAYLQAIFPTQSDISRYYLMVADRDGSNKQRLFPQEGMPGLEAQKPAWSPGLMPGTQGFAIAVIYQGDVWLVDVESGRMRQITGEGLVSRIDWK